MRNFNVFLLFLSLFCCSWRISSAQNCNLPAPTGLTWTYPTQNTVKFTWNSVQGAWGYRITLNAQNTQGQGQTIQAPAMEATFTYNPNTTYTVELYAGCSATNFSSQKMVTPFSPDGLIIVVDINPGLMLGCDILQLVWSKDQINTNTTYISDPAITVGKLYNMEFKHNGRTVKSVLRHDLDNNINNSISYITNFRIYPDGEWGLSGSEIAVSNYFLKANFKKNATSSSMKVNVDYYKKVVFVAEGDGTFSDFKIYQCLADTKNNDRNQENIPTYTASPNPFLDQINVFLKGQAEGSITAKMLDTAGQLKWIQQYDSASLQDQTFVIQTQDMPAGMYFLQIADARGLLQTQRLIKQ